MVYPHPMDDTTGFAKEPDHRAYAWLEHDLCMGYVKPEDFVERAVALGIDRECAEEDLATFLHRREHGPNE
jgi:hypothetical protein